MEYQKISFTSLAMLIKTFKNGIEDKIPANENYHYQKLYSTLNIYPTSMTFTPRNDDVDNVLNLMKNLSQEISPSELLSFFPKIIQSIKKILRATVSKMA
jgi:hypothetical protein